LFVAFVVIWLFVFSLIYRVMWRNYVRRADQRMVHDFRKAAADPFVSAYHLSPEDFEVEVARVITAKTGLSTCRVGGSGDGGVDVIVYDAQGRPRGIVQCKRYAPNKALSPDHVRAFAGVKQRMQVKVAYLVTTAYVTPSTLQEGELLGVRVIGGKAFDAMRRGLMQATP
jgi:restriction endonuclease Mrr